MIRTSTVAIFVALVLIALRADTDGQTTAFNYQGQLQNASAAANGSFDFEFLLFDSLSGGTQVGSTITKSNVQVANGVFAVSLDFGSNFPGANRFLEIHVRQTGGGTFTQLLPRQPVLTVPYSIKAINADSAATANNASNLGGVGASQFVQTNDARLSDARNPLPGNASYVQNQAVGPQVNSNFSISGTGKAAAFDAAQYHLNGTRALAVTNDLSLYVGVGAGPPSSTGTANTFVGLFSGASNTTGFFDVFVGENAGQSNTSGDNNTFVGSDAGRNNTSGRTNAFFGAEAGSSNTTAIDNSFFGTDAGRNNSTGTTNAFFGAAAGKSNTTAGGNAFFGGYAGTHNTTGLNNSFFGLNSGFTNTTAAENSFFGTASGYVNDTGENNSFFGAFAGNTNSSGSGNSFFGDRAGIANTTGIINTMVGYLAGSANTTGNQNVFLGSRAGNGNTSESNNTFIGALAHGTSGVSGSAAIGVNSEVDQSNSMVLGNPFITYKVGIGTTTPDAALTVNGTADKPGGGSWAVFSDERLKKIHGRFDRGLNAVMRLRPLRYEYKSDNKLGIKPGGEYVGFSAQAVQKIIPEAVTTNEKGFLLVNNDPIIWTMLNAIQEQQAQIEGKQKQLERQEAINKQQDAQIEALKGLVCKNHRRAAACHTRD